jgi:alkylation response protein AidB-like acyl-CoA dehydrogenase
VDFELECVSSAGARLAELAEKHAVECAVTADQHDREGSFPRERWAEMGRSGFLAATVPEELGGLGVASIRDLVVGISRLARGDGSVAIGAAMHTTALWNFSRLMGAAMDQGSDAPIGRQIRLLLRAAARGRVVICVALSERGTSLGHPRVTATADGAAYRISGTKVFCTNSPAATLFLCSVRIRSRNAPDRLGFALIPRDTPGIVVRDDWDAMGMRASGSGAVSLGDCLLPDQMVMQAGPVGSLPPDMFTLAVAGALVLAGAFLGIAEHAQNITVDRIGGGSGDRGRTGPAARSMVQAMIAENEIDLASSRAVLDRAGHLLDQRLSEASGQRNGAEMHSLMREVQCSNMVVKRAAINVVDRCMTVSGGAGYLSANLLSRLYRDVRAGLFMQPFSTLDAPEYIGQVRLGLDTELDG